MKVINFYKNSKLNYKSYFIRLISLVIILVHCSTPPLANSEEPNLIIKRKSVIEEALNKTIPVIELMDSSKSEIAEWQEIFLNDARMKEYFFAYPNDQKMLNEIFSVSLARTSDIPSGLTQCANGNCIRIEMYNYARNISIIGLVSKSEKKLLHLASYKETQPDLPPHLVQLANYIARHDTSVIHAYGENYNTQEPLMSGTKTALNRTKCQRSKHLCVSPTFIKGSKALWVIVDLTDLNVAGVRWTDVGETGMAVTQRSAQNDKIMECFCDKLTSVDKEGWKFTYSMTRSDGLMISDISYKGVKYFNQVKLVDWHVSYSKVEGFGYSDAIGCPEFSTAAVLAIEPPYFEAIVQNNDTTGFLIGQSYYSEGWPTPCNYNYHQYFEFYKDGRFRPVMGSIGRGCGNNGMYRPVTRISIAGTNTNLLEYKNGSWNKWTKEKWALQSESDIYDKDHQWFKIERSGETPIAILANTGQMRDHGRGDHAYVYATKRHLDLDEGESDFPTIGPCCNQDYHQGPEKFINDESIENSEIVFWYVAQIENDDTKGKEYCWAESILKNGVYVPVIYPCYSGPMFKPL